jgi:eukaryotic-like serine/threonine-protein kinase
MSGVDSLVRTALEIFEASFDWPEQGAAFEGRLLLECAGRADVLSLVRSMLEQDQRATRVIPTAPPEPNARRHLVPPERIARWKLADVLGVGGMGAVYRAERADGVFDQTVAIKLLRPGLFSAATEARFAEERRMLARLRHPNIAQIYDGGTDASSGHAWLAMEYVVGSHITSYVAQGRLRAADRLKLFVAACEAIQHAHQNLIVHADIKPSNILVTPQGEVKLLDFGIGQWLENTDKSAARPATSATNSQEAAFTPAYAAPERLTGSIATPVGDVYSLGVLLNELLDVTPAVRRDADLRALLDKARALDPSQRYQTAAALADDVTRYLGHFPLQARTHNWRYVSERFVRRHPRGVALGALAALSLVGATIITSTLYVRAEHARAQADQRFQEVRQLAKFMIFDLYDELARVPGTTAGRRTLVTKAQHYLDRLSADGNAPLELKLETESGRARLATITGVPGNPNLGDVATARRTLDQVISELNALRATVPERSDIKTELAAALLQRAAIDVWADQHFDAADPRLARARALLKSERVTLRVLQVRQQLYVLEADVADWRENAAGIRKAAEEGLAELATWPPDQKNTELYALDYARILMKLGDGYYYMKDLNGALVRYREAMQRLQDANARWPDRPALLGSSQLASWSIATTLSNLDRNDEALPEFETAIAFLDRMRLFEKNDVALLYRAFTARSAQAEALSIAGQHGQAIGKMSALLLERQARMDAAPDDVAAARGVAYETFIFATILERAQRKSEACHAFADAVERFTALDRKGNLTDWDRKEQLEQARKHFADACVPPSRNRS